MSIQDVKDCKTSESIYDDIPASVSRPLVLSVIFHYVSYGEYRHDV